MFEITLATPADYADILALQELNHLSTLPEDTLENGFLTTYLTIESMDELRAISGLVVARGEDGVLAGFAGAHGWNPLGEHQWHRSVAGLFPLALGDEANGEIITAATSFQYGPACVSAALRGQGVLAHLVGGFCRLFPTGARYGITFIDHRNLRSLAAHGRKLGFQQVAVLPFDITTYHVFAFRKRDFL